MLIPTLGREQELLDTIQDLLKQTRVPDEIVVIDQNQPRIPSVDQALAKIPFARHVRSARTGYSWNLNVGLKAVTGEVVLFLDDDVKLDSRLVENHLKHYEGILASSVVGVAGRVLQPTGDSVPEKVREVGRYRRWSGTVIADFNGLRSMEVDVAPGGNMSLLRSVLLEAGGFDTEFDGTGYRCETDLCLRVTRFGKRMIFEPAAELVHLMAPRGGCRTTDKAIHTYSYVKNGLRLYRKHSPWISRPYFSLRMGAYVTLKAIYNHDFRIFMLGWKAIFQ